MGRAGRDTLVYAVGALFAKAVSFVMLPVYTRYLTPADYGVMQLVEMTLDVISIFAGTRIALGVFRYYHKAETEAERKAVLSTAMILIVALFGLFAAATALLAPVLSRLVFGSAEQAAVLVVAAAGFGTSSLITVPTSLMRLEQRSVSLTAITTAKLLLQVGLNLYFLAVLGLGVTAIFLATLIANVVVGVALAVPFVLRQGFRLSRRWTRDLLRYGLPLVATNVAAFIVAFGDRYFLRVSGDLAAVGLYSLSYQFGFLLLAVSFGPFLTMWEPLRFAVAKRADHDRQFSRAFLFLNLLVLSAALGVALLVDDFIAVMTAPAYHSASRLVPLILVAHVLLCWAAFHENGVLVKERTEFVTLANGLGAVTALAGYAALIPPLLGLGAAVATLLAYGVRFTVTYVASQRLWPIRYEWGPVWRLATGATLVWAVSLLVPRTSLLVSLSLRTALLGVYAAGVWFGGVIPAEDRERLRALGGWRPVALGELLRPAEQAPERKPAE
jgi:O-antigen/teichoic acid export membrane protein